jgi:hypothetical protein
VSVTRIVATYSVAEEYIKHPNDVIYYTAPVFFWTNIELSLAIVCACLPTLRPIWFHFNPRPVTSHTGSGYGSSKFSGTKNSSFGAKYGGLARKPYQELDEMELTRYEQTPALSYDFSLGAHDKGTAKVMTVHQTLG